MWIYLIKYLCEETGEMRWLYEAKGESESLELCRRLEANGKKPELHRVYLSPSWLLSCDPDGERISDFSSELANV